MHKLDWTPGEEGKGVVDANGVVHSFNQDEYELHHDYLAANPHVQPISYFYVSPDGGVNLTYPHPNYDGQEQHDEMLNRILEADPGFHKSKEDWDFG